MEGCCQLWKGNKVLLKVTCYRNAVVEYMLAEEISESSLHHEGSSLVYLDAMSSLQIHINYMAFSKMMCERFWK